MEYKVKVTDEERSLLDVRLIGPPAGDTEMIALVLFKCAMALDPQLAAYVSEWFLNGDLTVE